MDIEDTIENNFTSELSFFPAPTYLTYLAANEHVYSLKAEINEP